MGLEIKIAILLFIVAAGYGVVSTYNTAIENAKIAEINTAKAIEANQSLEIALVEKDFAVQIERAERAELQEKFSASRADVQKLEGLFQEHDFSNLYDKKPGLILKRVNTGTQRVFRELATTINGTGQDED
jgi:signal recognition particle GTPase